MDETFKSNPESSLPESFSFLPEGKENLVEQHVTSLPLLGIGKWREGDTSQFIYSFHWTVRFKVIEMTKKKAAILLKILSVGLLSSGVDFSGYIAVEFLTAYLKSGKLSSLDIVEEKDRQACLLGELILCSVRGDWISLGERIKIPPSVIQEIINTGWLPDKRTFGSWKAYYNVRSFIEIHTVPLENYNERDTSTIRYNSYTKGYGNGGHISRLQKTPYTSELDGEDVERESPGYSLEEIDTYNRILLQIERMKAINRREK